MMVLGASVLPRGALARTSAKLTAQPRHRPVRHGTVQGVGPKKQLVHLPLGEGDLQTSVWAVSPNGLHYGVCSRSASGTHGERKATSTACDPVPMYSQKRPSSRDRPAVAIASKQPFADSNGGASIWV
jgi:hypothetical protein